MRRIEARTPVMQENDRLAAANEERLAAAGVRMINVLASPGAGKTSLLTRLLPALPADRFRGVIEGDVAGRLDTEAILALGFPAVQINTGGGCHLSARMIAEALPGFGELRPGWIFIENIGNLICPVAYRLGETLRLAVASVAEGDDKPAKYPAVFADADAIVLNKIDLVGATVFDRERFERFLRIANPQAPLFPVSCRTGEGLGALAAWICAR